MGLLHMQSDKKTGLTYLLTRWGVSIAGGVFIGYLAYFMVINPTPGFPRTIDLTSWFAMGRAVIDGKATELYNLDLQAQYQKSAYFPFEPPGGIQVFNRPPFFIIPYVPLSILPFSIAYIFSMVFIILTGGWTLWLIATQIAVPSQSKRKTWLTWVFISLSFLPVFQGIYQGQTSLLELLILSGFYLCLRKGREFEAGAILALGSFKPQMVLFFALILIIRSSWRGLAGLASVAALFFGISLAMVHAQGMLAYIHLVNGILHWNCTNGVYPEVHQTLRGLVVSLLVPSCFSTASAIAGPALERANLIANSLSVGLILILVGILWMFRKILTKTSQFSLLFSLTVIGFILASPYSNRQELTALVLVAALIQHACSSRDSSLPAWFNFPVFITISLILGLISSSQFLNLVKPFVLYMVIIFGFLCYWLIKQRHRIFS